MPLESCMILLDNSEFMRNGDYIPTRMEAQNDAANLLVGQKTQSNPESTVGVIAMSGGSGSAGPTAGAELLVSPTDDMGKILSALHGVPIRGSGDATHPAVDIAASVQVASLALKHRRNKNGAQRVVLFVGSPLDHVESRTLTRAGKQLKKNNVAIDVVALGELEANEPKLRELVDAANGSSSGGGDEGGERTCHLVTIPPGVLPSDVLVSSPIVQGAGGGGGGMGGDAGGAAGGVASPGGAGAFAEFGGVDPNMDPELAMALRVSMEEERARQERAAAEETKEEGKDEEKMDVEGEESKEAKKEDAPETPAAPAGSGMEAEMGDEDALLQQALAMSMSENAPATKSEEDEEKPGAAAEAAKAGAEAGVERMDMDEDDAAMQMALQMSMQAEGDGAKKEGGAERKGEGEAKAEFQDPQFVNQLLGSLPGVNPNDPAIQSALRNLNNTSDKKDKKEEDAPKKDGDESK